MARRTRRDLSNKRIRKIVHKKLRAGYYQPEKYTKSLSRFSRVLKPIFYIILLAFFSFIIYQVAESFNFTDFFSKDRQKVETSLSGDTLSELQTQVIPEKEAAEEAPPPIQPVPEKIQVEVLNGCGVAGIAKKATDFLRRKDIDVVSMGNYRNYNVAKSQIIDRVGNKNTAKKIAKIMGINSEQVNTKIDKTKQLAASVIIGKDYKKLDAFKK